ncbi:hypothetical protein DRW03_10955 [Corallococcus sp. H22C18031201]|uniref:PEGA domain-containing protein n=1 Tax=Citreicoccus inhibens TaxID=2849499 RepID=UPI000E751ABD|nr:PEGA domain-containing protein [Citreicoccus inhibens]MBU8898744.1 PEGA domain-containing protein [Citreicoccus inhibens]RJS24117.1 hypothetical protein DRW03_10955 [Corallococcus sp. H22C18031201]
MRIPAVLLAALALGLGALPCRAWAQAGGLGLDLSDSSSQPAAQEGEAGSGEVGLDLRADGPAGSELLPRLVVMGLDTPERAGAQQSGRWVQALGRAALGGGKVALGTPMREVRERLAEKYTAALRCATTACMSEQAESLDADVLVMARLSLEDAGWTLRSWTYDRDFNVVHEDAVTGRNPKDATFQREASAKLASRVAAVARPRAVLKVTVNVPQAVVRVGERTLGVGSLERHIAPGKVALEVSADEYTTFTQTLTLAPGERQEVTANLEITGPSPDGPGGEDRASLALKKKVGPSGPSIFKRPALYTALVGLAVVGVGAVLGSQAKNVEKRAKDADGDGVIDVTPKERDDAKSQANLATALMAGGGAVAAGSVVWLVLVPTKSPVPSVAPVTSGPARSATSLQLVVGGSF